MHLRISVPFPRCVKETFEAEIGALNEKHTSRIPDVNLRRLTFSTFLKLYAVWKKK